MRRRDFLRQTVRVGIASIQPRTGPLWTAFEQQLKELGYTEGENLFVEFIDLKGPISSEGEAMKELSRHQRAHPY